MPDLVRGAHASCAVFVCARYFVDPNRKTLRTACRIQSAVWGLLQHATNPKKGSDHYPVI
jgi:hypothetical protein